MIFNPKWSNISKFTKENNKNAIEFRLPIINSYEHFEVIELNDFDESILPEELEEEDVNETLVQNDDEETKVKFFGFDLIFLFL